MATGVSPHLETRLTLLQQTIPSAKLKRSHRGILATCRELTDHLRRVEQLRSYVESEADRAAVESLIVEIDRYRDELSDHGQLAGNVRKDREQRRQKACITKIEETQ